MKLWLISQTERRGYGTYDSAVVAAKTEDDARNINPSGDWKTAWCGAWATSPANVSATYIGEAKEGTEKGIILDSFNAG